MRYIDSQERCQGSSRLSRIGCRAWPPRPRARALPPPPDSALPQLGAESDVRCGIGGTTL
eukprot:4734553-Pleurochrysis_carterae.AAC.2